VRFVADESCDFAVVRALRSAGHDVVAVAESHHVSEMRKFLGSPEKTRVFCSQKIRISVNWYTHKASVTQGLSFFDSRRTRAQQ
jgi:hypothetical protein